MLVTYAINPHGYVVPYVDLPGKDCRPIEIFLEDIRFSTDDMLWVIDRISTGEMNRDDWSGDRAFGTITKDGAVLEAQWVFDESGVERGETISLETLKAIIQEWRDILLKCKEL